MEFLQGSLGYRISRSVIYADNKSQLPGCRPCNGENQVPVYHISKYFFPEKQPVTYRKKLHMRVHREAFFQNLSYYNQMRK